MKKQLSHVKEQRYLHGHEEKVHIPSIYRPRVMPADVRETQKLRDRDAVSAAGHYICTQFYLLVFSWHSDCDDEVKLMIMTLMIDDGEWPMFVGSC